MRSVFRSLLVVLLAGGMFSACDSGGGDDGIDPNQPNPRSVAASDFTTTESGLQYFDFSEGTGDAATEGDQVFIHFHGWLSTGELFASSILVEQPIEFTIGDGEVIAGWEEGIQGMKVGGERQLVVPPELAFGNEGAGSIPPGETITLEVELLLIAPEPQDVPDEDFTTTDTGLQYFDFEVGTGEEATPGSVVNVHYDGWLANGYLFDTSYLRGAPISFVLGSGQVIAGWDEGIEGMRVGSRRQLQIPPALGYGAQGRGVIPPNAPLTFEVELMSVE